MSNSNRSVRVRTELKTDSNISVNLEQDIDHIEILSLNISTDNFYKNHTSKYGCVVGRVLANDAVGIPNAKISMFVAADSEWLDDEVLSELYPYTTYGTKNSDNIRYNLLPSESVSTCHTPVGTFPTKRMVIDDDNYIEVYDKFYKFTTVSNKSGDYMLFGVPTGDTTIHTDIDLSDIGFLSQRPRDMIYKGYSITEFENANKFKSSTNLDNLTQLIQQNDTVSVASFWGKEEEGNEIKITRNDISIQYEFTPTCVFLGSLVTDSSSDAISQKCIPSERMGKMNRLTTGAGTIEMIRKKDDGSVEEFQVQGNQLIDGNGTWCYQIPMNLDYVKTDEYGNIVPCEDPNQGIPTRARVRFRISLNDFESDHESNHLVKVLVPNNPKTEDEVDYHFGSYALDSDEGDKSFRDLFWNNVYTVKSYIPRIQKGNSSRNKKFSGFKSVNVNDSNNPIPYNNIRIRLNFMFTLMCATFKCLIWICKGVNWFLGVFFIAKRAKRYMTIGDGVCPDLEGWYFAPGARNNTHRRKNLFKRTLSVIRGEDNDGDNKWIDSTSIDEQNTDDEPYCLTNQTKYLTQCIEINLAMEYEIINFDFYNDWLNGLVYIPHWFARIKKKRTLFWGLIKKKAKTQYCSETYYRERRISQQCALIYSGDTEGYYTNVVSGFGCKSSGEACHKSAGRKHVNIFKDSGIVHSEETIKGEKAYYFKSVEFISPGKRAILFATDIVLLGSLNDCDSNGLPQAYKYMSSTSYLMPTNLAKTNMDNEGFMYGYSDGSSLCTNGKTTEQITVKEQTFDNYIKWSKKKEYYEKVPDDVTEYAVTEAAGIDWGYSGPNQGDSDGNSKGLYRPGGHFLGISCVRAQSNIKSCVNLSRICELGTDISARDYIMLKKGDDIKYAYLAPTGLITKDDISESSFRSIFATLNSNGLKTEVDPNTAYRRYKFIPLNPVNFNGELKYRLNEKYNPTESKPDDASSTNDKETQLITRAFEDRSNDYYRFRFGLGDMNISKAPREMKKHFLLVSGHTNTVSMPVYENSFYFYFGLKDGSTAIDRFFTDFFASCDTSDEDASYFVYNLTASTLCGYDDGLVNLTFNDVDNPYAISMYSSSGVTYFYETDDDDETDNKKIHFSYNKYWKCLYRDGNNNLVTEYVQSDSDPKGGKYLYTQISSTFYTNDPTINITGFIGSESGEKYYIHVESSDGESADITINMGLTKPVELDKITVNYFKFSGSPTFSDSKLMWNNICVNNMMNSRASENGLITISNYDESILDENAEGEGGIIGFLIATDSFYTYKIFNDYDEKFVKENFGFNEDDYLGWPADVDNVDKIYVWRGNDTYTVYAIYYCGDKEERFSGNTAYTYTYLLDIYTGNISADIDVDIYIGDNDLLYNSTIKPLIDKNICGRNDWFNFFLLACSSVTQVSYVYLSDKVNGVQLPSYKYNAKHNLEDTEEYNYFVIKTGYTTSVNFITSVTPKQVWNVKKALYYQETIFGENDSDTDIVNAIRVGVTGGTAPYTEFLVGSKEKLMNVEAESDELNDLEIRCMTLPVKYYVTNFNELDSSGSGIYNKTIENATDHLYNENESGDTGYTLSKDDLLLPTYGVNYAYGLFRNSTKRNGLTVNELMIEHLFGINDDYSIKQMFRFGGTDGDSAAYGKANDKWDYHYYTRRGGKLAYGIAYKDGSGTNVPEIDSGIDNRGKIDGYDDADGSVHGTIHHPTNKYFLTLESIYLPFFFNTLFVISGNTTYKDITDETGGTYDYEEEESAITNSVTVQSIINNGVTMAESDGKGGMRYKFSKIEASVNGVISSGVSADKYYRVIPDIGNVTNKKMPLNTRASIYDDVAVSYRYEKNGDNAEQLLAYDYYDVNHNPFVKVEKTEVAENVDFDGPVSFSFKVKEGIPSSVVDDEENELTPLEISENVTLTFLTMGTSTDSGNIMYGQCDDLSFLKHIVRSYDAFGVLHFISNILSNSGKRRLAITYYRTPRLGYFDIEDDDKTVATLTAGTPSVDELISTYNTDGDKIEFNSKYSIFSGVHSAAISPYSGGTRPMYLNDIVTYINSRTNGNGDGVVEDVNYDTMSGLLKELGFNLDKKYVLGIYDKFTDANYDFEEWWGYDIAYIWNKLTKDTNQFSVVKIYTLDEFIKILVNKF